MIHNKINKINNSQDTENGGPLLRFNYTHNFTFPKMCHHMFEILCNIA